MMLRNAIVAATQNMLELYDLSGGIKHDGEKGAFREFFIAQLVRPLLPHHYGVGSGVVVDADGQQSRQTDLIIYDRRLLPPIMVAGDRGIFPIDSVLAVVEVKSMLKKSHYEDLVDAARRLSPRTDDNPSGLRIATPGCLEGEGSRPQAKYPLCSLFAYTADAKRDEAERLEEKAPGSMYYLRLIGVLDKGVWCFNETIGVMEHHDVVKEDISVEYMKLLLNRIEEAADSRGKYRLQDWL